MLHARQGWNASVCDKLVKRHGCFYGVFHSRNEAYAGV